MPDAAPVNIRYSREAVVEVEEFRRVLMESGLGNIRPVGDAERLAAMLANSNVIVTARRDDAQGTLLGVLRGMTDEAWCCYVSDLAVATSAQGLGVGQGLLAEARRQLGPEVSIILVSVPEAVGFYRRAGLEVLPNAFWIRRVR
ncbi:MAG: GNAT family N-acetyltransferase [Steroidobacteraceae bacterium]